jgi:hypothetical protein
MAGRLSVGRARYADPRGSSSRLGNFNDCVPITGVDRGPAILPLRNGNLIRLLLMGAAANLARHRLQESRQWRR